MTKRENFLTALKGGQPEYVPSLMQSMIYGGPVIYENKILPNSGNPDKKIYDPFFDTYFNDGERYIDILGIDWTKKIEGAMPTPGIITMTDITKWKEQLNYPFPDLNSFDFAAQAEEYYSVYDRNEYAVIYPLYNENGPFMTLMNAMGVADAMIAMVEEPEACHEFFNYYTEYEIERLERAYPHFKMDLVWLVEDVATQQGLFMSPSMYDEMLAPYHRRIVKAARDLGIHVELHCCGKCEELIPRWVDMGIQSWNPAQPVNNLKKIKEEFGSKFTMDGGYSPKAEWYINPNCEEEIRNSVRNAIDMLAPGGGYVFWDALPYGDSYVNTIVEDEFNKYGSEFYSRDKK